MKESYDRATGVLTAFLGREDTALAPLAPAFVDARGLKLVALPPLTPGRYRLETRHACEGAPSPTPTIRDFDVQDALPFPTKAGELVVVGEEYGTLKVRLDPAENIIAFLPASIRSVRVNGEARPGFFSEVQGGSNAPGGPVADPFSLTMNAYLDSACIEEGRYVGGVRNAEVTYEVRVAGVDSPIEPARFAYRANCDELVPRGRVGTSIDERPETGCAVSRSPGPGTHLAGLALGACALAAVGRRRGRPRS